MVSVRPHDFPNVTAGGKHRQMAREELREDRKRRGLPMPEDFLLELWAETASKPLKESKPPKES